MRSEGQGGQHRHSSHRWSLAGIIALSAILAGPTAEPGPRKLRLMLFWTPQSQFAGYYMAREKGIYAKRGLEVEIIRGGPDRDPVKFLEEGKTDFAVLWLTSALSSLDRGVPLAHVAQVFNSSNLAIVGWKEKGVNDIRDLEGRRVSVWGEPYRSALSAFFKSQKLSPMIVPQYYTINLFLLRGVDACTVMYYNEYHVLYQSGIDASQLSTFFLRDQGIDFPEDGIYCLRATRDRGPETCKALREATLEGWKYASEHPEETLDVVMKHVNEAKLPTNRTHMQWMLKAVLSSVFPAKEAAWEPGVLSRKSYEEATRWLLELGQLKATPTYEEFTR